jgi:predicted DCC family thiol-disulfide oxidoreductase YuxK
MKKKVDIVYDKACPVCHTYCVLAKKADSDVVNLVDAREDSPLMRDITEQGLDIDEGMVVKVAGDDQLYYGAEAIHRLAELGESNAFDRVNRLFFASLPRARVLYPALKQVRNIILKILGVSRINNLAQPGKDKF